MAKIVVIGSLNMDVVAVARRLPGVGETIIGSQYLETPGGKGANQAYAAARLGADVAMLGRIGSDYHGGRMVANLAAAGCDVSGVQSISGASGVAVILVEKDGGQNSIVVVPGANGQYLPSDVRKEQHRLRNTQLVLLQLEIPLETVVIGAEMGKRCGARVILDPAPAPKLLPPELLRCVDILTPNETEAAQLAGWPAGSLNSEEAGLIARQLQAVGAKVVIIKLGAQGCLVAEGESTTHVAAPRVDVVDTTAAGDVFNAALSVACSEGASLVEACRFAVNAAAVSVTRLGAQRSMPTREELGMEPP